MNNSAKPLPKWLVQLLKIPEDNKASTVDSNTIPKGQRNIALTKFAGSLRRQGLNKAGILNALKSINDSVCDEPLPKDEIASIAESVGKYSSEFDSAAPISISTAERKWLTAKELLESKDIKIEWILEGLVGLGMTSTLTARPKAGKTTWLFEFLEAVSNKKQFLGFETHSFGKILLLTEEPLSLLKRRFKKLGFGDDQFLIIPKHKMTSWQETIAYINHVIEEKDVKLVIIDTIAAFWPVKNENDASDITAALNPLQKTIQKNNTALLLIHHLRKADGDEGTAIRGSGQFFAMVEVGMELTRISHSENRRQLTSLGRYEESNKEIAIEFTEDGYKSLGSVASVKFDDVKKRILEVIPEVSEEPISDKEIRTALSDPKPPSKTTTKDVLAKLTKEGKVKQIGNGVKNDPYKYSKRPPWDSSQLPFKKNLTKTKVRI